MRPVGGQARQSRRRGPATRAVEARERLVEQQQARIVQQRPLEREPLAHAAREARDQVVGARLEPRVAPARRVTRAPTSGTPWSVAKNVRFSRAVSSG